MRNGITKNKKLLIDIWKMREVYILILLPVIWYIIFSYIPIYGLSLAFKTYKANLGIFGSPWVGIENYKYVFRILHSWNPYGRL